MLHGLALPNGRSNTCYMGWHFQMAAAIHVTWDGTSKWQELQKWQWYISCICFNQSKADIIGWSKTITETASGCKNHVVNLSFYLYISLYEMGLLRTIAIILIVYYVFKFISKYILPLFVQKIVKDVQKKYNETSFHLFLEHISSMIQGWM